MKYQPQVVAFFVPETHPEMTLEQALQHMKSGGRVAPERGNLMFEFFRDSIWAFGVIDTHSVSESYLRAEYYGQNWTAV